ncbi:hypothetical protein GUJ93_ZPchr0012g18892 [Zizania palustris]|uniref:Uncharacterized protein n=1 Tax=Zizania palustris TaxID=103762 RepID=A0A8J6BTF5_ZIZPA|nr:hypothetical protein GUJ93_ZPchr0012g18892 [Zizania palustris]KAG8092921.1 hypothetical protein GUJ93_ZPchr0012g18892 [Zizania palustris]
MEKNLVFLCYLEKPLLGMDGPACPYHFLVEVVLGCTRNISADDRPISLRRLRSLCCCVAREGMRMEWKRGD